MSHQAILDGMERLGIDPKLIAIVSHYLRDRTMRVRVGDVWSREHTLSNSAPQGAVGGCSLFLIAFSRIRIDQEVQVYQYADDSSLCWLSDRKKHG